MSTKKLGALVLGSVMLASVGLTGIAHATEGTAVPANDTKKTFDVACVQTAIDAREVGLSGVVDTHATAIKTALSTRATELKAAWALSTSGERRTARFNAWKKYFTSLKTANSAAKTARKSVQATFKTSMSLCGAGARNIAASEIAQDNISIGN